MEQETHYTDLSPETRQFIENLREEDIALLQDGLRLVRATQTVSKFMKWVIISLVGAFIAGVGLAENIIKVTNWFKAGK